MSGPSETEGGAETAGNGRQDDWYRRLLEEATDLVAVVDPDGTVTYVNGAAERLLGHDPADLIGEDGREYVHPEDAEAVFDAFEALRRDGPGPGPVEFRGRRADGTWCWLEATMRSRLDDEIDGIVVTGRDVTERKERETDHQTTKERMTMAIEGANLGIWDWDMETDELVRDELLTDMLGYTPAEMGDRLDDWEQLVHPAGQARHDQALAEHVEHRTPYYQCEYRLKTKSGEWKWVRTMGKVVERDETGEPVRAVGIHQDIDDRKRAELALEAERDMFKEGPAVVFKWADADGWPITYVSENVEGVFGYTAADIQSQDVAYADFVHEDDLDRLEREMAAYDRDGSDLFRPEPYRIRTADGEVRWVMEYTRDLLEAGEQNHLLGYIVDVTERKQRELELQQFEAAVEQSAHAIYMTDTDGTIEYVNPAFETVTGYTEAEVVGETPRILQSGEYGEAFYEEFWETILDGDRWEAEMLDERADGEEIVLDQTVAPITDDDGQIRKFVAVARDVTERKLYEEALDDAREELRQVIDLIPDLIFAKNREGEFLLANETTAETFGMGADELEGTAATALDGSRAQFEGFQDDLAVIDSGKRRVRAEGRVTTADGDTRLVQTTKIPFETPKTGEDAVLSYARDVTELKERERELRAREEKYRNLFEDTRDALMLMDRDGYRDCNEQALDLFGVESIEAFLEYTPWELSPPTQPDGSDSRDAALDRIDEAFAEGEAFFEWTHQRVDGTDFPAEVKLSRFEHDGEPVIHALVRDISDRKGRDRELQAREQKYRNLFEDTRDALMLLDRDGFFDCNERTLELFGIESVDAFVGHAPWELSPPTQPDGTDSQTAAMAHVERAFEEGEAFFEWTHQRVDGTVFPAEIKLSRFEHQGQPALHALVRDISARKAYERQLEEQRDNLKILNQVVRHDIRNDIQLITAYADLLGNECDDEEAKAHIETIIENADHAVELTTSAREMADVMLSAEEELQQVGLDAVLESELQEVRSAYSDVELTRETGIPSVAVQANDMLGSVFRNLLKNAIQHNDKAVRAVAVSATDREDTVVVRVADNGPGVPDDQKDAIFGKAEKGLDSQGTGIGLYLVQTLVESYGGDIWVEDRADHSGTGSAGDTDDEREGAVFVVELPKATAD